MTVDHSAQKRREEFEQGYKDGFHSVQGNVITPHAPHVVLEVGRSPYDQGYAYGVRDGGGN